MVVGMLALASTLETMESYRTSTLAAIKLSYKRGSIGTACKTAIVFSVYAALYVAHFRIHHRGYAIALGGAAFIVHPLAATEATAIIYFILGLSTILQAFFAKTNLIRALEPQLRQAAEQASQEGFQVPDQWWALPRISIILHQKSIKRCQEIFNAILKEENKYDAAQAFLAEILQLKSHGIKFLGICCINVMAAFILGFCTLADRKRIYDPLDLNKKIKNFSIWLVP